MKSRQNSKVTYRGEKREECLIINYYHFSQTENRYVIGIKKVMYSYDRIRQNDSLKNNRI